MYEHFALRNKILTVQGCDCQIQSNRIEYFLFQSFRIKKI